MYLFISDYVYRLSVLPKKKIAEIVIDYSDIWYTMINKHAALFKYGLGDEKMYLYICVLCLSQKRHRFLMHRYTI